MAICQARTGVLASVEAHGALDVGEGRKVGSAGWGRGVAPLTETSEEEEAGGGGCSEVAEDYLFISPLALPPQR